MAAGPATLVALDGNKVPFNHPAVQDANGQKAPANGILDPNGVPLIPAAKGDVQALGTILGSPSQDATVAAVTTAVQALLAPLQDLDGKAATASAQSNQATILSNILTALGPLATDADLQAATAKLELIRALLAGTLNVAAASLPLPSGAATESTLAVIKNAMLAQASISESLWYDPTINPATYYFRQVIDTDGTITYAWKNTDGSSASPNLTNIKPVSQSTALQVIPTTFDVLAADTGTSVGDVLLRVVILNLGVSPPSVVAALWINATTGAAISAPTAANIKEATRDVTVASSALPTGAATSALQTTGNTSLSGILSAVTAPALASGAATSANQSTEITALGTLHTDLTSILAKDESIRLLLAAPLVTKSAAPTPVASSGYVTALLARNAPCTAINVNASNASQTVEGYLVVVDSATVPAANAAITPLKKRRLPTNDGAIDGTTEIDTPFSVQNGLVALLTTSLTTYTPGALTGVIDASYL